MVCLALTSADERRRQGRRRQRPRAGRQQQFDLGPPPQPVINIPEPAAPLPVQAAANRFIPTGPAPGSAFPPESAVIGHIPDRDGNYDFE